MLETKEKELFWVSAYEDEGTLNYIADWSYPGEETSFFGFFKRQNTVTHDSQSLSKERARLALSLFLENKAQELKELLRKYA
ncbi:MAG: hypothetical protein V7752_19435 [Halopseudomonas sp.]